MANANEVKALSHLIFSYYRPQTKFGARLYFQKCVSRILFPGVGVGGGGIPACIAGGIPACLAGLQAHTQGRR